MSAQKRMMARPTAPKVIGVALWSHVLAVFCRYVKPISLANDSASPAML